jgi:hypothetical protein
MRFSEPCNRQIAAWSGERFGVKKFIGGGVPLKGLVKELIIFFVIPFRDWRVRDKYVTVFYVLIVKVEDILRFILLDFCASLDF